MMSACHDRAVRRELRYRKDLYKGTAEYYDRFRPLYPAMLLTDLRARVDLDGTGRLLDLACGTGQVAFALAGDVAEVWAVDQEAESIEFGRRAARRLGVFRGEVVPEGGEGGGGCGPAEGAVGSVVIVEVDERVVGGVSFGF
jgi:SAM-dependent methyltransferase